MWREVVFIWLLFMLALPLESQEADNVKFMMNLLAKDAEELSEDEILHYSELLKRPLRLNSATAAQMQESGLMTRYQAVSIIDYRRRSGQILSFTELAALDGFSDEFIQKIRPFLSLECVTEINGRQSHEITGRTSLRSTSEQTRYGYASRYKFNYGERLSLSLASSRSLDASSTVPDALSGSIDIRFRKMPLRLAAGDFNARFGQGLALWSGADFSSLNDPSAYLRRSSGITSSSSFTGNDILTGGAAELDLNRFCISAFLAFPGIKSIKSKPDKLSAMPACNATWLWKYCQAGMTHYAEFKGLASGQTAHIPNMKTSIDFSACFKGVDLFSEFMHDWVHAKLSALAGTAFPLCESADMAAMIRSSRGEHMFAISSSYDARKRLKGSIAANVILYSEPKADTQDRSLQLKFHTQWQYALSDSFAIKLRITERVRSWGEKFRTDVRSDFSWQHEAFSANIRFNILNCIDTSFLTYAEGGFKPDKFSIYLRLGLFYVDNWEDRIYAYERDAPGCYNSPAFYGRGVWSSFYASCKFSRWCRLYLRAGYTAYPFIAEKKPGKAELRLQTAFSF